MQTQTNLLSKAIKAAKTAQWEEAIVLNQALLELNSQDIGAYNRIGVAYLQLNKPNKARQAFKSALKIDHSNPIAKKHLEKIKQKSAVETLTFTAQQFIEEPGKTKTTALHRLAGKDILTKLKVGNTCTLLPKNRYISVESDGMYIGALPEDLSFRLTRLIKSGNDYICYVRSVSDNSCCVFLKEKKRSKKNASITSFPVTSKTTAVSDYDESLMTEDIPMEIISSDDEDEPEKSINATTQA